jgi:eukaryotic-like serine/threonine-protein kinase
MQPARVGPYTLLRLLGRGSLGQVLLARTDKGGRVALKVFRPELAVYPRFRTRLREEIDALALVHTPRVPAVLDADPDDDVPWLATDYVPAPPLHEVVAAQGPLDVPAARLLGIGLAEALASVHEAGTVHGDLKPGDVLLAPDGPRVTDAGLARAAAATPLTRGGALVGTLGYLAPEQVVGGAARPASDVFALGSVLLFAATWRRPFGDGDATAVLHRVLHGDPDLGGLSPELATVVAACLHRDPDRRPGLAQVRETLLVAARADGQHIPTPSPVARPSATPLPVPRPPAAPVPAPTTPPPRTLSRAHRVASAAAVSVTLVGLLGVTSADARDATTLPTPRPAADVQAAR